MYEKYNVAFKDFLAVWVQFKLDLSVDWRLFSFQFGPCLLHLVCLPWSSQTSIFGIILVSLGGNAQQFIVFTQKCEHRHLLMAILSLWWPVPLCLLMVRVFIYTAKLLFRPGTDLWQGSRGPKLKGSTQLNKECNWCFFV